MKSQSAAEKNQNQSMGVIGEISISGHENHDQKTEEEQLSFYQQYCKLHVANVILSTQLKELNFEKTELLGKLHKLEKKAEELSDGNSGLVDQKKRRVRRAASEIARHYKCLIEGCSKSYGSEGSLNQHIKIKHPEVFRQLGHYTNSMVKQSHQDYSS